MNIVEVLVRVLAPVLSFTTDEVWEHYPEAIRSREGRPGNVQLAGWPEKSDFAPSLPDDADAERICNAVDGHESGVVAGILILAARIAEADNEPVAPGGWEQYHIRTERTWSFLRKFSGWHRRKPGPRRDT